MTRFHECPHCHAFHDSINHKCSPRKNTLRITGEWKVEKVYHKPGTDVVKLRLKQGDMGIGHTIYNVKSCDYEVGESEEIAQIEPQIEPQSNKKYLITIPKASYVARKNLCIAVVTELNKLIDALNVEHGIELDLFVAKESADPKNPSSVVITVSYPVSILTIRYNKAESDNIFSLMGASFGDGYFAFRRGRIENSMQLCFVYLNIVQQ